MPFAHSKLLLQATPVAFCTLLQMAVAGTVSQKEPAAQPTLVPAGAVPVTLHVVAQAVLLVHAKLFAHATAEPPGVQVPVPLQLPAGVSELTVHEAGQVDVDGVSAQTPPVAQVPLNPHGGAAVH
jgi:hypothetical protein